MIVDFGLNAFAIFLGLRLRAGMVLSVGMGG